MKITMSLHSNLAFRNLKCIQERKKLMVKTIQRNTVFSSSKGLHLERILSTINNHSQLDSVISNELAKLKSISRKSILVAISN